MDCDENDFQSQNLHLAGEGGNKFPPVLRPYALPKFNFDDSLHGRLRFDNLVETEGFLGIESNEVSQWIEDFSQGSSGIQFSSAAAESCLIGCNNVWSEVTSSKSVEILLKFVGQEAIIPLQANTRESDACDELCCIIKKMNPDLKQDNAKLSNVGDAIQPTLLPCEIPEKIAVLDNVGQQQSQVEDSTLTLKGSMSEDGGASDLTAVSMEVGCPVTIGSALIDDKCNNVNQMKANNRIQGGSTTVVQHDCVVNSIATGNDENAVSHIKQIADYNKPVLEIESGEAQEQKNVLSQKAEMDVHILHENVLEIGATQLENPLYSACIEPMEEANTVVSNYSVEDLGSSEDFVIDDQMRVNTNEVSLLGFEGNSTFERKVVDDCDGSQLDNKDSDSGASLLSAKSHNDSEEKLDGSGHSFVGGNTNVNVVCSSVKVFGEAHDNSHVLPFTPTESEQACKNNVLPGCGDTVVEDAPTEEKKSAELPSDGNHVDATAENDLIIAKLQLDSAASNKSLDMSYGDGISANVNIGHKDGEMPPLPILGFSHLELEEETEAKTSPEACSSDMKTWSPVPNELSNLSENKKDTSSGLSGQMLSESANESPLMLGTLNLQNQREPLAAVMKEANCDGTKEMEVRPILCDSAARKGDGATEPVKDNDEKPSSKVSEPTVTDNKMLGSMPSAIEEPRLDTIRSGGLGGNVAAIESRNTSCKKIDMSIINECERNANLDTAVSDFPTVNSAEIPLNGSDKKGVKGLPNQVISVADVADGDASKVSSVSREPKQSDVSKDERSLTFEVSPAADLHQKEASKKGRRSSTKQAGKVSLGMDVSLSTCGLGKSDPKVAQDLSCGNVKGTDVAITHGSSKVNTERRPRRASSKSKSRETTNKGTVKDTAAVRLGEKMGHVFLKPSEISQLVQSSELQRYGHVDSGGIKPFIHTTSNLLDLNSSTSQSVIFQQHFTDLQQVQLRAQILVYGAMIQGTTPDEEYMISAFGGPDGRSIWENSWQSCMERLHGQKSYLITPETHLQSCSGVKAPELAIKQNAIQNKVTPSSRPSTKGTTSPIVSAMLPLSSPLWSMSTPTGDTSQRFRGVPRAPVLDYQQASSPLLPHQTPPVRNFVGHNPSWISQAPFGPWDASPHNSVLDSCGHFSEQLSTETVQLTPVKESVPHSSTANHVPPGLEVQSSAFAGVFTRSSPVTDVKKITASSGQSSVDPKPGKRKKTPVADNLRKNTFQFRSQTDSVPTPAIGSQLSTSVAITPPIGFVPKTTVEKLFTSSSPMSSLDFRKDGQNVDHRTNLSEETLGKVKDAKMQAENAAILAAVAFSHRQELWNQLDKQRNFGLLPDVESKLASAAVAIAAAAAVAKAAAAAADIASNAALQAKLMADEAIISGSYRNPSQHNVISISESMKHMGEAAPLSILKGDDGTNGSSSIFYAVREAARRRGEAASGASKQAENMDAIVKAAELTADAVSQAGKVVAMNDPLSLSELVAAGPEGYWKVDQVSSEQFSKAKVVGRNNLSIDCTGEGPDTSVRYMKDDLLDKREITDCWKSLGDSNVKMIDGLQCSGSLSAKDPKGQKSCMASDSAKTIGECPESETGRRSSITGQNECEKEQEILNEKSIKEGSLVEVFKDGNRFKAAWFSANVLSLKDGKAYVSYTDLTSGEDLEKLKEWVALEGEGDGAPPIRIARPITAVPLEGTRKRRRAAMCKYNWSVGSRVDAWIQDSWWEGVITEKNKKDETVLTVHFPVRGENSAIKVWHLRPSLVWKDGKWVEWSSSRENDHSSHEGDTPQEKRPKLRSPAVQVKEKDKTSTSINIVESNKPNEPTLLEIAAHEKMFNIGKSSKDSNKSITLGKIRAGLQKEGSKVIVGVPKPGKKRKFMDVSKRCVADRSGKINKASDSVKFKKFLIPQGTETRGWKNTSKVVSVEKCAVISDFKGVKSGKVQNESRRTIPRKDNLLSDAVSSPDGGNTLGKLVPTGGKLVKIEEDKVSDGNSMKSAMDIAEPRRSNRRMQPTSRLLEGLQSSSIVSKVPSVSNDESYPNTGAV